MSGEIKPEMWETTIGFLEQIGCDSVEDVAWKWEESGVKKITVTFEHPIYLTDKGPKQLEDRETTQERKIDNRKKKTVHFNRNK